MINTPIYEQIKRHEWLLMVRERLSEETEPIIRFLIDQNLKSERQIGYRSGIRLLMPYVEVIGDSFIPKRDYAKILEEMNVPAPLIVRIMYRNALFHGDLPNSIQYRGALIKWKMNMWPVKHQLTPLDENNEGFLIISIPQLFNDIEKFLDDLTSKNDQTLIRVQVRCELDAIGSEIQADLQKFGS